MFRRSELPGRGGARNLAQNATLRLPRGRFGTVVRVDEGSAVVTQEGDREDHVLVAGDELLLPAGGLAVAWALTRAAISVREAPPTALRLAEARFRPGPDRDRVTRTILGDPRLAN